MEQAVTALENAERRKYKWTRLLLPLLSYKVYLLALVYLTFQLLPSIFATEIYHENFHWPPDDPPSLASAYKTWDGNHYLYLSEMGYQPGAISNALIFYDIYQSWREKGKVRLEDLVYLTAPIVSMFMYFSKDKWKGVRWLTIGILFSLQIIFLIRHINNYWVG